MPGDYLKFPGNAYQRYQNNQRLVISTNTINLQEQLINKDIPLLHEAIEGDFRAEVMVATSVTLCEMLHDGRLDFALARLAPGETQLEARMIAGEPLSLVVRRGHPILVRPRISFEDLLGYDWVMGDDETLLTQTVIARMTELGLPLPRRRISTSSFLFTLALLNQTDAIAPLATPVVDSFAGNPSVPFVSLPVDLGLSVAPFSLITRTGSQMTPSAQRLADAIRDAC